MQTPILMPTSKNLRTSARILRKGGLVVFPTETVYGLGCDPFNVCAVERLIAVKGSRDKPLPVLSSSLANVERIAELSFKARKVAKSLWPGPLTLILPRKSLPKRVTFGMPNVGIRMPKHKIAMELIKLSGGLLIGTSANKSGGRSPTTAMQAYDQLTDAVDVILDGGQTDLGVSSTVVELIDDSPKVLRKGPVSFKAVLRALGQNDGNIRFQAKMKFQEVDSGSEEIC